VRADVIDPENPLGGEFMFDAEGPLFGVGAPKAVLVADQRGSWEELVVVSGIAGTEIQTAERHLCAGREGWERHIGDAGGETGLSGTRLVVEDAGGSGESVVGFGVVRDLRVVNAEAAAKYGLAIAQQVIGEAD